MEINNSESILQQESKKIFKERKQITYERIMSNSALVIGFISFMAIVIAAIVIPFFCSVDPNAMTVSLRLTPPNSQYIFGTDAFGRDLFIRIMYGARVSLIVGGSVAILSCFIGMVIGIYASYFKLFDDILMRICEGLTAIPGVLLAIALMASLGASNLNVIIALTIVYTPSVARVVRSSALVAKEQVYVKAAKVQGASNSRILWKLILPNVISPLTVQASFIFAQAIISEASLSFLGVGIPAPAASWGNILQESKAVLVKAPWSVIFPGIAVILCVLSLNLLGDGLRDYFDPRTIGKRRK